MSKPHVVDIIKMMVLQLHICKIILQLCYVSLDFKKLNMLIQLNCFLLEQIASKKQWIIAYADSKINSEPSGPTKML